MCEKRCDTAVQNGVDRSVMCLCECAQQCVAFHTSAALLLAGIVIIFQVFCQSDHLCLFYCHFGKL